MMQQIILDGVYLPQRSNSNYACWEDLLSVEITMISGRVLRQLRCKGWRAL